MFFKITANVQATTYQPKPSSVLGWQAVAIVVGCLFFFFTNILKIIVVLLGYTKISRIFV